LSSSSLFARGDQAGVAAHAWIIPVVGALISFLGVPAGLIGNELSRRSVGVSVIATGSALRQSIVVFLALCAAIWPVSLRTRVLVLKPSSTDCSIAILHGSSSRWRRHWRATSPARSLI